MGHVFVEAEMGRWGKAWALWRRDWSRSKLGRLAVWDTGRRRGSEPTAALAAPLPRRPAAPDLSPSILLSRSFSLSLAALLPLSRRPAAPQPRRPAALAAPLPRRPPPLRSPAARRPARSRAASPQSRNQICTAGTKCRPRPSTEECEKTFVPEIKRDQNVIIQEGLSRFCSDFCFLFRGLFGVLFRRFENFVPPGDNFVPGFRKLLFRSSTILFRRDRFLFRSAKILFR